MGSAAKGNSAAGAAATAEDDADADTEAGEESTKVRIWPACCCGLKASIRNKAISKPACTSGAASRSLRAIIPI